MTIATLARSIHVSDDVNVNIAIKTVGVWITYYSIEEMLNSFNYACNVADYLVSVSVCGVAITIICED